MSVRFLAPLTLLVATSALVGCSRKPPEPAKATPPIVSVTYPVVQKVSDYEDFAGRTEPLKMVELRSRVSGDLRNIYFKDGQDIEQGKPLFEIDDRLYKADLDTARASLALAEARLVFAIPNAARYLKGNNSGTISDDDKDQAVSNLKGVEASIASAKAAIDTAETNLKFCRIYAPFDGRLSMRKVDEGNLVKANDTLLTNIVPLDEMYATFDVDERTDLRIRRLIGKGEVTSSRELELWVQIALADEDDFSLSAKVVFTDNQVDAGTGTRRVRATVRNPRLPKEPWYLLSPGQFVRVRVPIGPARDATLVPEMAIGADQGQRYVYVVNAKNEVVRRDVRVGQQYGKLRVIEDGAVGLTDRVIVEGLLRVRQGVEVSTKEYESPKPKASPAAPVAPMPVAPDPHAKRPAAHAAEAADARGGR
jgi:multidrug efflux system membrane fusion protein